MTRIDPRFGPQLVDPSTASQPAEVGVVTHAADDLSLSSGELHEARLGWEAVIDRTLIDWATDPTQLEDEDVEPPTRHIIGLACSFARMMLRSGQPAPRRVVPNGEGGIVFERWEGPLFESIEIDENGSIEHLVFVHSRLELRQNVDGCATIR